MVLVGVAGIQRWARGRARMLALAELLRWLYPLSFVLVLPLLWRPLTMAALSVRLRAAGDRGAAEEGEATD